MKPRSASQPGGGLGRRTPPMRIPQIPMEWMDPMSWRLPSGKALAEFALQAGFLAPLMLGTPNFKKKKAVAPVVDPEVIRTGMEEHVGEAPEDPGTFRDTTQKTSREIR
jgi:hypothetical protein